MPGNYYRYDTDRNTVFDVYGGSFDLHSPISFDEETERKLGYTSEKIAEIIMNDRTKPQETTTALFGYNNWELHASRTNSRNTALFVRCFLFLFNQSTKIVSLFLGTLSIFLGTLSKNMLCRILLYFFQKIHCTSWNIEKQSNLHKL